RRHRTFFASLIAVFLLLASTTAHATSPVAVQNITAKNSDGIIIVTWDSVPEIDYYRVYFSSRSILENSGAYDDYEATDGAVTEHALTAKPASAKVYLAVLAVNKEGEESSVFLEEAFVLLEKSDLSKDDVTLEDVLTIMPTVQSSSDGAEVFNVISPTEASSSTPADVNTGAVPVWQNADTGGTFHLLLAEALSPTQVRLQFNTAPYIEPTRAPEAFHIFDSDGDDLRITSIYLYENTITVRTETQQKDAVYQVKLSEPLMSVTGAPLDSVNRKILFRGHLNGEEYKVQQISSSPSSSTEIGDAAEVTVTNPQPAECTPEMSLPKPVKNLHLKGIAQADGTFTVQARWGLDTGKCQAPVQYIVRQSIDGGINFSLPEALPIGIGGIDIPGIISPKYAFGLRIQSALGPLSTEVFDVIELPISPNQNIVDPVAPTPVINTPSVPTQIPTQIKHPLTQSGMGGVAAGLVIVTAVVGGIWSAKKCRM
ncbi:MAG: hypothetical protein KAS32_17710, partial [Candidatus Peribacteraceae bacterium]|nr:hypothetical protein [Candidatus Peribacteraceae bacterium]